MPFEQLKNPSMPSIEKPEEIEEREPSAEKKIEPAEEIKIPEKKEPTEAEDNLKLEQIREELKKIEKTEREPKEVYLEERLGVVKNKLSEYFPDIYREIPTKLDYQDQAEELRVHYSFDQDKNLAITIRTPENLSNKSPEELKESKTEFLVFKRVAGEEKISKKVQDFFFLTHEYTHGLHDRLIQESRPDLVKVREEKKREFLAADSSKRKEMEEQLANSGFSALGESVSISTERLTTERLLRDPTVSEEDKKEIQLFWQKHQESLLGKKLEKTPKSEYTEFDEAMIYYKLYQEAGEKGILNFVKNFNFDKLSKIQKYSNPEEKVLSEEYKKFLEMNGKELLETFAKEK